MKNPNITSNQHKTLMVFFSLILAVLLSLVPWEYLRSGDYYDRQNYINYIDLYLNKVYWFDFSGLSTKIFYEWGWHYFLDYMKSQLGFDSNIILFLVSFFVLTISFVLVSSRKKFYLCFFLLNPLYIDFFYSQIRLSFAIAFIYLSLITFDKNKYLSAALLIPSLFIHTSSFLFVFIFYSAVFLAKIDFMSQRSKFLIALLVGLIASLAAGPYMSILLGSFDDRRAEYNDMSSPILYMVYWLGLFIFFMIKYFYKKIETLNYYYIYITMSILTMVFLNVFLIGYSSRFLAASFPFLILAMSEIKGKNGTLIRTIYVLYTILLWFFWMNEI